MHHNDAPNLAPATDITDLYAFQQPGDPERSVFIVNVYPDASARAAFDPLASYELKIDADGDAEAEIAFHVRFTPPSDGQQTATVYRVDGPAARASGDVGTVLLEDAPVAVSFNHDVPISGTGAYRFFAGLRSDPFFADRVGLQNNMQWTGQDFFADKNVLGIVLEAPNRALGPHPRIGVWARTLAPVHDKLTPVNQAGRPGNNVFKGAEAAAAFNTTPPAQQRACFLEAFVATFQGYGFAEARARALALEWLPDILSYDYTSPAGFPNGRLLSDDVADYLLRLLTAGAVTTDLVGAHTDYLTDFPYLAAPHLGAAR